MLTSENQPNTTTTTTKSPEILFSRGLSVFLDPVFSTSLDTKSDVLVTTTANTTSLDLNNSEKTCDLTDYLYHNNSQKPPVATTLTQLEPVRPNTPHQHQLQEMIEQKPVPHSVMLTVSECSMDSQASSYCSSLEKQDETTTRTTSTPRPNKRGRKPAALHQTGTHRSKFGKHEMVVDNNQTKTLVYFGNKRVEVGTDEYDKRRKNNNDAVKKCRQKMEKEQKEREEKMSKLMEENQRLSEKVNTMSKEMEVLKGIIISMKPDNTLPEYIQKSMNDL